MSTHGTVAPAECCSRPADSPHHISVQVGCNATVMDLHESWVYLTLVKEKNL